MKGSSQGYLLFVQYVKTTGILYQSDTVLILHLKLFNNNNKKRSVKISRGANLIKHIMEFNSIVKQWSMQSSISECDL